MATANPPRTSTAPPSQGGASIHLLHEFFLASCAEFEPSASVVGSNPLDLSVAPADSDTEFAHEHAFGFMFAEEMGVVRQLRAQTRQGRQLFTKIYFARACAVAIPPPPPTPNDSADVTSLLTYYNGVYEVLQPQVAKLRMMCDYCTQTVVVLCDTIQRIAAQENTHRVIPDVLMDSIVDLLDTLLQMNLLHDAKTSLRNDFSMFKRAFKHVKGDVADADAVAKEIQRLQELIGKTLQSRNSIYDSLRHNLTSVKRYDQVVFLLVKHCLGYLEHERTLAPNQRFKFVRVLPCLATVLYSDPVRHSSNGFTSAEKRLLDLVSSAINRYPIVPVFADVTMKPTITGLDKSAAQQFDASYRSDKTLHPLYDLLETWRIARNRSVELTRKLMFAINKVPKKRSPMIDQQLASTVTTIVWEGVQDLCDWKTSVELFLAMKYQRPKSDDQLEHMGIQPDSKYIEYQSAITYNIEAFESEAIATMIHTIKALVTLLHRYKTIIVKCISAHVSAKIQHFVQHTLVPILHRADKKKHSSLKALQDARLMCGNWIQDDYPVHDYKKRRRDRQLPDLDKLKHAASPTLSQLNLLRTVVDAVYSKRTSSELEHKMNIFAFHRELKSADTDQLHRFYNESASFCQLLDLDEVLLGLSSFHELLFREMFLDATKQSELPVDDSLPWIILKGVAPDIHKPIHIPTTLSLIDVYNDASYSSLVDAEHAVVFDEVSAEAKLFFDNLIFLIADHLYASAKNEAARVKIGSENSAKLEDLNRCSQHSTGLMVAALSQNLASIAQSRFARVVDQDCDLVQLIGGHINSRFMRDIVATVNKMARADATIFVAIVDVMDMLRNAHSRLVPGFILGDFMSLWEEATTRHQSDVDEFVSILKSAVSTAITQDLAVNYGFNERTQRFIRISLPVELRSHVAQPTPAHIDVMMNKDVATTSSRKLLDSVGLSRACRIGFDVLHQPFRSFYGTPHIEAMLRLISHAEAIDVVEDCIDLVTSQIGSAMHLFVPVLGAAIPPYRYPKLLYRTEGCYGFFESKFKNMMESEELEAHVFHCLRVIGNTLLVVKLLSEIKESHSTMGTATPTIFEIMLRRIRSYLEDTELSKQWGADVDTNPECGGESPSAFFLVWSALEYMSCCPRRGSSSYREVFGEGVHFAGCTLIHLLGQRDLYDQWNPSQFIIDASEHDTKKQTTSEPAGRTNRPKSHSALPDPQIGGPVNDLVESARMFVAQATQMRKSVAHFFGVLESTWSPPTEIADRVQFTPPAE